MFSPVGFEWGTTCNLKASLRETKLSCDPRAKLLQKRTNGATATYVIIFHAYISIDFAGHFLSPPPPTFSSPVLLGKAKAPSVRSDLCCLLLRKVATDLLTSFLQMVVSASMSVSDGSRRREGGGGRRKRRRGRRSLGGGGGGTVVDLSKQSRLLKRLLEISEALGEQGEVRHRF